MIALVKKPNPEITCVLPLYHAMSAMVGKYVIPRGPEKQVAKDGLGACEQVLVRSYADALRAVR